jgi:hypothetical protein
MIAAVVLNRFHDRGRGNRGRRCFGASTRICDEKYTKEGKEKRGFQRIASMTGQHRPSIKKVNDAAIPYEGVSATKVAKHIRFLLASSAQALALSQRQVLYFIKHTCYRKFRLALFNPSGVIFQCSANLLSLSLEDSRRWQCLPWAA